MSVFCASSELFSSLGIVLMFFHILIKVRSDHNKLNRFMSVFTQFACNARHLQKEAHFKFGFGCGNIMWRQLYAIFKQELIIISLLNVNYFS